MDDVILQYIDYVGSWGPAIVGHAHPEVTKALQEQLYKVRFPESLLHYPVICISWHYFRPKTAQNVSGNSPGFTLDGSPQQYVFLHGVWAWHAFPGCGIADEGYAVPAIGHLYKAQTF